MRPPAVVSLTTDERTRCNSRWFPPPRPHPQSAADVSYALQIRKGNDAFADALAAAVEDRGVRERRETRCKRRKKCRNCRRERSRGAVFTLERDAEPVRAARAQQTLCSALREPAGGGAHEHDVGSVLAADEVRVRAHGGGDAPAAGESLEPRERVR